MSDETRQEPFDDDVLTVECSHCRKDVSERDAIHGDRCGDVYCSTTCAENAVESYWARRAEVMLR